MLKKWIVSAVVGLTVCVATMLFVGAETASTDLTESAEQTVATTQTVTKKARVNYRAKTKRIQKKIDAARDKLQRKYQKQYKLIRRYRRLIRKFKRAEAYGLTEQEIATLQTRCNKLNALNKRLKSSANKLRWIEEKNAQITGRGQRRKLYRAKQNELQAIRKQQKILNRINTLLSDITNVTFN